LHYGVNSGRSRQAVARPSTNRGGGSFPTIERRILMAKRDTMTAGGTRLEGVNIDQPVGRDQTNKKEDVMLDQAMLEQLAERYYPASLGLRSWDEVPEPNGKFKDGKPEKAIWSYQRKNARRLLNVDGKVHPAAYTDRNINFSAGRDTRLMTI